VKSGLKLETHTASFYHETRAVSYWARVDMHRLSSCLAAQSKLRGISSRWDVFFPRWPGDTAPAELNQVIAK